MKRVLMLFKLRKVTEMLENNRKQSDYSKFNYSGNSIATIHKATLQDDYYMRSCISTYATINLLIIKNL